MQNDQLFPVFGVPTFKNQINFCVTPSYFINNRSDKRAFKKDAIRTAEFLQWIIDDFITALFDPTVPKSVMYETIYLHYLDIWNDTIRHLKNVRPKLKFVNINPNFFAENYAPKVKN